MMVERARVVAVDAEACWVETIATPACSACASGQGCGGGVIGKLLGERRTHLRVVLPASLRPAVDDEVEIGVHEHGVLRASALAYLLPLAGMVAGAVAGERLAPPGAADAWSMAAAAAGFLLAVAAARALSRGPYARIAAPELLRVIPAVRSLV
jgi:sigma-E factor negative regulatory protein RseC